MQTSFPICLLFSGSSGIKLGEVLSMLLTLLPPFGDRVEALFLSSPVISELYYCASIFLIFQKCFIKYPVTFSSVQNLIFPFRENRVKVVRKGVYYVSYFYVCSKFCVCIRSINAGVSVFPAVMCIQFFIGILESPVVFQVKLLDQIWPLFLLGY